MISVSTPLECSLLFGYSLARILVKYYNKNVQKKMNIHENCKGINN